ncbi:MAG: nicotinate-nucleotide--dimethylbenzimidazole phosphoribosyltransferase [Fusobacteriaceae bacterium]
MNRVEKILTEIKEIDYSFCKNMEQKLDSKMKPLKSLGVLEELAIKIAGITRNIEYEIDKTLHIVVSADNGIVEEGISSCPTEYTRIVSEAMLSKVAAIGILCDNLGVDLKLIDVAIDGEIKREYENLIREKISYGSENFINQPAMTRLECEKAIELGISVIEQHSQDYSLFSNGEMGIGNTTTSSAILYALTHGNIDEIVGRGGGLSDLALDKKKRIIIESCEKYKLFDKSPIDILATVGGYDIATMTGMYLGAAAKKKPMIVDGFISAVAVLLAVRIEPKVRDYIIMSHQSEEPGMEIILKELSLDVPLHMKMRLGEGTGAVFLHNIARCAMDIAKKMKTKEEVYGLIR